MSQITFVVKRSSQEQGDTDSSPVGNIVTPTNMTYSTDSKFGISSANYGGSSTMTISPNSNLVLGTVFTVRAWIKTTTAAQQYFLSYYGYSEAEGGPKPGGYILGLNNSGYPLFYYLSDGVDGHLTGYKAGTSSVATGDWVHYEFVRNGLNFYFFINGQNLGANAGTNPSATEVMGTPTDDFYLGGYFTGSFSYTGLIDEVEIIKNVALHTSNFTPPTEASTPTANHVLLMHMDDNGAV